MCFTVAVVMPKITDPYFVLNKAEEIVSKYKEAKFVLDGINPSDFSLPDDEMVSLLQNVVVDLGLKKPSPVAISDLRYWRYLGIPAFWYGLNGDRCSAANEFVEIELLHIVLLQLICILKEKLKKKIKLFL